MIALTPKKKPAPLVVSVKERRGCPVRLQRGGVVRDRRKRREKHAVARRIKEWT